MTPKAIMTRHTYTDDVARVFDRMERQHGVSFDFPLGIVRDERDEIAWRWYSHVDYDGIGVMAEIARELGQELPASYIKIRRDRDARWHEHLRPFFRRSYLRKAPGSPWDLPRRKRPASPPRHTPQHLILLTDEETREVATVARDLRVSVNTLLLWSLAEAVRGSAVLPHHRQHWTVPINMRGGVGMRDDMANPISFIRVIVRPGDTPQAVQARLYELLETGMHYVMLRWIRFFAHRSWLRFPPVRSTGTFSNVGVFHVPGVHRVITCPPVGPTEPIAGCVVTWNGRMSIALSVHASMAPPAGAIDAVGARWRAAMLSGAPARLQLAA
jgi:hypothetical protein